MIALVLLLAQSSGGSAPQLSGEKIFAQSCSVGYCHGVAGGAGRGPRLRGRTFDEGYLLKVVREGIPRSAMPAWEGRLTGAEILEVVRYVESLSNNVPGGSESPASTQPAAPKSGSSDRPPEVERGRAVFLDATRETPCAVCHELEERGIAVGPDLAKAVPKAPAAIEAGLRNGPASRVIEVHTRKGERFPAFVVSEDERFVRVFDLTAAPPSLRTIERSQIESRKPAGAWNHAPYLEGIAPSQMADLIAYLRWLRTRS
jgi:mono/diheme cytochrome c family protein